MLVVVGGSLRVCGRGAHVRKRSTSESLKMALYLCFWERRAFAPGPTSRFRCARKNQGLLAGTDLMRRLLCLPKILLKKWLLQTFYKGILLRALLCIHRLRKDLELPIVKSAFEEPGC